MTARTARDGLLALLWGFLAAVTVTLLFGLAVRWSGKAPDAFLSGIRPVADFINKPDVFSLIVAVLAGIVGVVSLTQARSNALIGVFISVTTIPAAASLGVSVAFSSWREAGGSALQLLLNVVVLIVVTAAWRSPPSAGSPAGTPPGTAAGNGTPECGIVRKTGPPPESSGGGSGNWCSQAGRRTCRPDRRVSACSWSRAAEADRPV